TRWRVLAVCSRARACNKRVQRDSEGLRVGGLSARAIRRASWAESRGYGADQRNGAADLWGTRRAGQPTSGLLARPGRRRRSAGGTVRRAVGGVGGGPAGCVERGRRVCGARLGL